MNEAVPTIRPNRGWSHSAFHDSRIGLDPWGSYWESEAGAAWTLLPIPSVVSPEHPWTAYVPREEDLAGLGSRSDLDGGGAWEALIRHDEGHKRLLELEHGQVDDAMFVRATAAVCENRQRLSAFLRESLCARVGLHPAFGALHGAAEMGFVHLAARLTRGSELEACLNYLGDWNKLLRVCELTGAVFHGSRRATRHPKHRKRALPAITPGLIPDLVDASIGASWVGDPTAAAAAQPRYTIRCGCGDLIHTTRLDVTSCKRCGSVQRRVRRHRGDLNPGPIPPRDLPAERRAYVLLIDDDDYFFETSRAAEEWVSRNVPPTHNGRRTIQTIEGYTLQRAWERTEQ